MVAPAIGALVLPALGKAAKGAAGTIGEALTADLAVVRWSYQPHARRKVKPAPVDMELHVNPAAIGVAAVGIGLSLWLMQLRVQPSNEPYGRWKWLSDGTWAGKEIFTKDKAGTHTRLKPIAYQSPKPNLEGLSMFEAAAAMTAWGLANTETAIWVDLGTKIAPVIKQRQGFLGNGIGTITTDEALTISGLTTIFGPVGALLAALSK